jgi:hypothetical protein
MTLELARETPPRSTDRRTTVPLPEPPGAIAPVTARHMRRAALVYAGLWVLGMLPVFLGAGAALLAAGLGVVLPGGGFLFNGDPVFFVVTLVVLVLSLFIWWATGPVVLPPLIWIAAAVVAALTANRGTGFDGADVAIPAALPVLALAAYLVHRVRHAGQMRRRERFNAKLAEVEFTISGPPALDSDLPVVEHSATDLEFQRYALDLALQPIDSFDGFAIIDQFREAAIRYQCVSISNGLAMGQYTRTPAFTGYVAEAQRNAIEKILQKRVWGYWAVENAWGNLSRNRDPLDNNENIMLSGWHGTMVAAYETLNDDRYSQPGSLTYRWSDTEAYPYSFGGLAEQIHRSMTESDYTLFPCEPNWVYAVCNTYGMNTLIPYDRLHGTSYFAELRERLQRSYEQEFMRPDGRLIGVRSVKLGLSWNFWSGAALNIGTAFWMHPALPEVAQRTWWLVREETLKVVNGQLAFPLTVSDRLDPGNYKLGRDTFAQLTIALAGREMGDEEVAAAAQQLLDSREPTVALNGARRYKDASPLLNCYANLARFGRRSGLRDLVTHGTPEAWRTGPRLAEAAYPDVLVARALTDGHALDLVLRPGAEAVRTTLGIERLVPGREYRVDGGRGQTVTADVDGRALVEIDLGDRLELRIY